MKILHYCFAAGLIGAGLCLAAATPASAQMSTPTVQSEDAGAGTGLGSSHRFASVAAADDHCPGDTIVWSSGPKLVYHLPGTPDYGYGKGFYACKAEADDAGFSSPP